MAKILATLSLTFISFLSYAQATSDNGENLQLLLQNVFNKAKQYSVYKAKVDWPALESKVFKKEDDLLSSAEFTQRVRLIFQTLGDKHGGLSFQGKVIRQSNGGMIEVRPALRNAFRGKPIEIKTSILEDGYGYILVPGTGKNDTKTNQQYQDSLCSLDLENLKGIIIDLRLNEGGSIYPMFTGFNQLFGNKTIGYSCDIDGKPIKELTVKDGRYYSGNYNVASVSNRCKPKKDIKVVVLTSQITSSAGEMLAVAFKGRKRTLFIGEKTAGYITLVSGFNLGTSYLGLSSSFIADRKGTVYYENVQPDVEMIEGDNFDNLQEDAKVKAALQWLKKE